METTHDADIPFDPSSHATDFIIRSSDCVDFYVVKCLLVLSSPDVFEAMFSLPQAPGDLRGERNLQAVNVTEESTTLRALLLSCYPQGFYDETSDGDDIAKAIVAAHKYCMDTAEKVLMQSILSHPELLRNPLHMYALGCRYGLDDLARVAAKNTLRVPVSQLCPSPELDYISGMDMYRLSEYRSQCVTEIWDWYFTTGIYYLFQEGHPWDSDIKFIWFDHASHKNKSSPGQACAIVYSDMRTLNNWNVRPFDPEDYVGIHAVKWFTNYLMALMRAIQIIPSRKTVFDDEIYYRAISKASVCNICGPLASEHLDEFRRMFANALDRMVMKVTDRFFAS